MDPIQIPALPSPPASTYSATRWAAPPPITGVVIFGNTIKGEGIDVAIKTPGSVDVHLNNLFGNLGIDNLGTGSVNATMNWWKCSGGPNSNGCATFAGSGVQVSPQLTQPSK